MIKHDKLVAYDESKLIFEIKIANIMLAIHFSCLEIHKVDKNKFHFDKDYLHVSSKHNRIDCLNVLLAFITYSSSYPVDITH